MKKSFFDSFFTGINYWDSKHATNMWREYDESVIEEDFKKLKAADISVLRVFLTWPDFQPLTAFYSYNGIYEIGMEGAPLPDTEAGRAGVSEKMCLNFENFCALAKKYDLKLIVGLITGGMSYRIFVPEIFGGRNILADGEAIKWQIRFVKYFVSRFKNEDTIVGWDLGNEVNELAVAYYKKGEYNSDDFYVWCSCIANTIRMCDSSRPIVSGMHMMKIEGGSSNLRDIGEICDIHTTHVYNIFNTASEPVNSMKPIMDLTFQCRAGEDIAGVPTYVQEFGATGYMNCSPKAETEFYRASMLACFAHNCHGVMWWCAFDQGHLSFAPYNWNNIGSDYGFFDKEGNEKLLAEENRHFNKLLQLFPDGLPEYCKDCTIIAPRDDTDNTEILRNTYILAKRANLDAKFCYALDPIPASPLYILPSLKSSKAITKKRLDEILEKVARGSALYISTDSAYFRSLPQITGVNIEARMDIKKSKRIILDGHELDVAVNAVYEMKAAGAKVIASDENGEPIFFENSFGKGKVYFLPAPIEAYLSNKTGVFHMEGMPRYDMIYRAAAKGIDTNKIADTDSEFIRLTEHIESESVRYIFALNYSRRTEKAKIQIKGNYTLEPVWGERLDGDMLTVGACDGVILKAAKK